MSLFCIKSTTIYRKMRKILFTIISMLTIVFALANEGRGDVVSSKNVAKRVVLEKNMVNGLNTLTQAMVPLSSGENSVYVIKGSFVLGENITMPANCTLAFEGGSITTSIGASKYTIKGQNTTILAGLTQIFGSNISLVGTWKVEYGLPEWFGAKGNGTDDDTEAFYAALSSFGSMFLSGKYSIDFRDVDLENKAIVGKWRTKSGIVQRNSNIPFALVKKYNYLNRFTFFAQKNTKLTDILHFGYSNEKYNDFSFSDITNVVFISDNNTIPLHFNIKYGGNSDCLVKNVRIYHCYIGVWYEFEKTYGDRLNWVTQCSVKDVTIYDPQVYGFKWDALSMYDQGKVVNGKTVQTMWCYNNYYENIGVDIIKDGATGFYIGQGMGTLVNPMVFNDIPAKQSKAVGYAVEFAPTGSPLRPKMVTNIIGGSFEGQIRNMDYAYINNIHNLKVSLRDNRGSTDRYITLDSESITDAYDFNIFGKDVLNIFSVKNAALSIGSDEFGEYILIDRIDHAKESYFGGGVNKQKLNESRVKNGLYTLQAVAQSNLGSSGTGFYFKNPGYRYTVDGQSGENIVLGKNGDIIGNNVFVNISDKIKDKFEFGYYFPANSKHRWIKIYGVRLMPGIIQKHQMLKPRALKKEPVNISRTFQTGGSLVKCTASFSTINDVTNNSSPLDLQCEGSIGPGSVGSVVTLGKLPCYNVPRRIWFQVYDSENGDVVGMCSVETDGSFKFKYTKQVKNKTSVYGSI